MNTIFFGASKLGYKCLKYILKNNLSGISAIFTIPENFKISYSEKPVHNVLFADFRKVSQKYNIPLYYINSDLRNYYEIIEKIQPDFMLAIGWYYLIPQKIRKLAKKGCVGIHSSLLPKYRGGAPLSWAIINGEKETGVSLFYFEDDVDAGNIIGQEKIRIHESENISDILKKVEKSSMNLLKKNLPLIAKDKAEAVKQDNSRATYYPQRTPEDGLINWSWETVKIRNFIRALSKPYPGAYTIINGKKIIIWDAEIIEL